MPTNHSILKLLFIISFMLLVLFFYTLHFVDNESGKGYLAAYIDDTFEESNGQSQNLSLKLVFDNRDNRNHAVQYELIIYSFSDNDRILSRSHFYFKEIKQNDKIKIDIVVPVNPSNDSLVLKIRIYDLTDNEEYLLEKSL